jgi:hypothetical protein
MMDKKDKKTLKNFKKHKKNEDPFLGIPVARAHNRLDADRSRRGSAVHAHHHAHRKLNFHENGTFKH